MSGLRQLERHWTTGELNMAILGTTYYGFGGSAEYSVFSSETHLNWRWFISQPNSAGWSKVLRGKIRISISLDTPLSWVNADFLPKIGMTLTLIRNTNNRQYCDYCKQKWGTLKDGTWHLKAQTPAYWKAISQSPQFRGQVRFYCLDCAAEVQNWPTGEFYSLKEQLIDALTKYTKGHGLNVELP